MITTPHSFDDDDIAVLVEFFMTLAEIEQDIRDSGDPEGILSENGWAERDA